MSVARRLVLGSSVWLCVLVGVLAVCGASAFAAAPEAPLVEVSARKASEVSLRGVLYPNATGEPGSYEFLYKQSATECAGGAKTASGVATGNQGEEVFQTLSGLQAGKQYTVCLSVKSAGGTTLSAPVTVTTAIAPEAPEGLKAEAVVATTASLHGVLNPVAERKSEPGSYEFLYKRSGSGCEGESATPSTAAAGAKQEAVSAALTGLLPHTTYTSCLRASNEAGEAATSAPVSFTTIAAAPSIEEASVSHATASSATFSAKINPQGAATSYTFEYAPAGGVFVPVPEAEGNGTLPEGTAGVLVGVHVQVGLLAHTAYQFRVTVANSVETVTGTPVSFTTQVLGVASGLADGREWEMVSPSQKEGALFGHIEEGIIQASADGNAFTDWSSFEPTEEKAAGAYGFAEANFFGRGPDGWTSKTIVPPHSAAGPPGVGNGQEYRMFSEDLSKGILQPFGSATPLVPGVSESTPYLRTDYLNGNPGEQCQSGCFQPLVSGANVPPGTEYGEEGPNGKCENAFCGPSVVGASPDLSHVVLRSNVSLTPGSGRYALYEWSAGTLQLVSLLPVSEGGGAAGRPGLGDEEGFSARHAISDDGSRVVWNNGVDSSLYMRDLARGETVRIDSPNVGAAGGGGTLEYMTASADVSRIFFLDEASLTVDASPGSKLYEYNLAAPAGSRLTDLSVDEKAGEAANVSSVIGASEDGSYVYFTAGGTLAPETGSGVCGAQSCAKFLYVRHDGHTTFIAGLSAEDHPDWYVRLGLDRITARVSPNGLWLAFMSNRSLTGYDNTDAVSGRPDEEVYLYDASASRLVCASCNPTGARPVGVAYNSSEQIVAADRVFEKNTWIAANVPPWTRFDLSEMRYQSRYLSDSGRLFFDSHDALVAQDVNGTQDVYEYEPAGVGDCGSSLVTFSERSGGCVALVSSGESSEESAFLDASETGGDVFFLTSAKLAPQDFDNAYDVYDARECDPRSRCILAAPVGPPACSTGDGCKAAPSPQPAIFGSPASATFSGAGNVAPAGPVPAVKQRGLTRGQKLARALRACHRKKGKRRAVCERKARARYAATQSRKANSVTKRGRG